MLPEYVCKLRDRGRDMSKGRALNSELMDLTAAILILKFASILMLRYLLHPFPSLVVGFSFRFSMDAVLFWMRVVCMGLVTVRQVRGPLPKKKGL